jgi:ABC-type dipeptide/oligopeptide/nickel transport system permease subunit
MFDRPQFKQAFPFQDDVLALPVVVLGFNFIGDALRDVFDPHRQQ